LRDLLIFYEPVVDTIREVLKILDRVCQWNFLIDWTICEKMSFQVQDCKKDWML